MNSKIILKIVAAILLMFIVGKSNAQNCPTVNCTNIFSGSYVTVNNGQTYCVNGSWSGGVTLNDGGTIYIAPGASLTVSYINGDFKGTVINCGTLNLNLWNTPRNVNIVNYGNFISSGIQNYTGTFTNYGRVDIQQFTATGATLINYKNFQLKNVSINNSTVTNYDSFEVNGNFYALNGGLLENKVNAYMSLNGNYGNTELAGTVENLGRMLIRNPNAGNGISKKVNNYGYMKIYDQVTIGSSAYFTNDSLLEFVNVSTINLQGALLQNNNRLSITSGNLALNASTSQVVNNGIMNVSGTIAQNTSGSKIVNNCRMISSSYFVYGGSLTENKGLIWVMNDFGVEGLSSKVINDTTGFIRGANFRNSGTITGYGSFYFTGTTNFQSAGVFSGNSASLPIQFFDASPTGNQIFDQFVANNPPINTIRPTTMTPMDTTGYICGSSNSIVGFPPAVEAVEKRLCANGLTQVDLNNYVEPHAPVNARTFIVQTNTAKLFEPNNPSNPTNNTDHLVIAGKGIFDLNPSTGIVTFTPNSNFLSGEVKAQYVISNIAQGDPIAYPSPKAGITITIGAPLTAPTIIIGN